MINKLPDSYGRGLAIDGGTLVVGAPDAGTSLPLAGAVEVFEETGAGTLPTERLESVGELLPPLPEFSDWYGKDVAVFGDLLAVVESDNIARKFAF